MVEDMLTHVSDDGEEPGRRMIAAAQDYDCRMRRPPGGGASAGNYGIVPGDAEERR
jgi:hypothetical protein